MRERRQSLNKPGSEIKNKPIKRQETDSFLSISMESKKISLHFDVLDYQDVYSGSPLKHYLYEKERDFLLLLDSFKVLGRDTN